MSDWKSVKVDGNPKKNGWYLICSKTPYGVIWNKDYYEKNEGWSYTDESFPIVYWMEISLPEEV